MIELKGKNGTAKVFTDLVEETAIKQVIDIMNSPVTEGQKVRIMPDVHAGAGCTIGTTITVGDKINPGSIGVDIGCGMFVVKLGKIDIDFKRFDEACYFIPSGKDNWSNKEAWNDHNAIWKHMVGEKSEVFINKLICKDELKHKETIYAGLASLGGGNHFIELDKNNKDEIFLVIHTGSRNLGSQVAGIYQEIAYKELNNFKGKAEALIADLKARGKQKEIEHALEKLKLEVPKFEKENSYLTGDSLKNYLHDMRICQEFAKYNRRSLATILLNYYFKTKNVNILNEFETFETVHNYINFDDMILRKGSVSAHEGEILIIPMNMKDGSLICRGLGNPDWNYSAPHGAGRLMSRSKASETISLDEFEESMKDVYTTSVRESTIDESPMAYKPMESIVDNIKETVEIVERIKPIYNFKA